MAHPSLFRLASDDKLARKAAEHLFIKVSQELRVFLPTTAEVLHIGATSIPGCLTKGDLDVVVRVEREDFAVVEDTLAARFAVNSGSTRTDDFAAFEDEHSTPHLGVQLTAKGGSFDIFHLFCEALRNDVELVARYNSLKIACEGQAMNRYRLAKDAFVEEVLLTKLTSSTHAPN